MTEDDRTIYVARADQAVAPTIGLVVPLDAVVVAVTGLSGEVPAGGASGV